MTAIPYPRAAEFFQATLAARQTTIEALVDGVYAGLSAPGVAEGVKDMMLGQVSPNEYGALRMAALVGTTSGYIMSLYDERPIERASVGEFRAFLDEIDMTQSQFARALIELGDNRPFSVVLRRVQRVAAHVHEVTGPMRVIIRLICKLKAAGIPFDRTEVAAASEDGDQSHDIPPEDRASMFIDWCALHNFGTGGWPEGAHAQLVAHMKQSSGK